MACITAVRFNMLADVLRQNNPDTTPEPVDEAGEWVMQQDPDSGEIIRKWIPIEDDPDTPDVDESAVDTIWCIARGIVEGGIKQIGTTARWSEEYQDDDYVRITYSGMNKDGSPLRISKRDRITNIRDKDGNVIWREEELPGNPPTVFTVLGMTPIPDPFGQVVEYTAMLMRSEVQ